MSDVKAEQSPAAAQDVTAPAGGEAAAAAAAGQAAKPPAVNDGAAQGAAAPASTPAAAPSAEGAGPATSPQAEPRLPVRAYLEQNVVPLLMQAMMELNRKRPADPIDFLCTYLQQHNPRKQQKT